MSNTEVPPAADTEAESEATEPKPARRLWRSWAEVRSVAHLATFGAWLIVIVLIALGRVRPWNEWSAWRKWITADQRGWETFAPGILMALGVFAVVRAHDRWEAERSWSPELVAFTLGGLAVIVAGITWGLFVLSIRPFGN